MTAIVLFTGPNPVDLSDDGVINGPVGTTDYKAGVGAAPRSRGWLRYLLPRTFGLAAASGVVINGVTHLAIQVTHLGVNVTYTP